MLRCYIACSYLERDTLYPQLAEVAEALGYEITYRWADHEPPTDHTERATYRRREASNELDGVADADVVIVSLGGRLGTHVELGAALAGGARVILFGDLTSDIATGDPACVFYDHPNVKHVSRNLEELFDDLRDQGCFVLAEQISGMCRLEDREGLRNALALYDRLTS